MALLDALAVASCSEVRRRFGPASISLSVLPNFFHSAVSGVHETADARPFRWLLKDSQPDVGSASNAFEGKMAADIIVGRVTFRLPECRWWKIERGTNFGDIDMKSGRDMLAVRSASEDFRSRHKQRDLPNALLLIEEEMATNGRGD